MLAKPGRGARQRSVSTARQRFPPGGLHPQPEPRATAHGGVVGLVLLQPLHFIMQTRQFRNLRARGRAQA